MANTTNLPVYVKELTCRPVWQNGIHIMNPKYSAITASCSPLIKSIQLSELRLPLHKQRITLPTSIKRLYKNWNKTNNTSLFNTLKRYLPQIMKALNKDIKSPITSNDVINFTINSPSHLIHDKVMHQYHED